MLSCTWTIVTMASLRLWHAWREGKITSSSSSSFVSRTICLRLSSWTFSLLPYKGTLLPTAQCVRLAMALDCTVIWLLCLHFCPTFMFCEFFFTNWNITLMSVLSFSSVFLKFFLKDLDPLWNAGSFHLALTLSLKSSSWLPLLKSFSLALAASASALAFEIWASTEKVELNADGDVTNCIEESVEKRQK